jgi:hypothetical protein
MFPLVDSVFVYTEQTMKSQYDLASQSLQLCHSDKATSRSVSVESFHRASFGNNRTFVTSDKLFRNGVRVSLRFRPFLHIRRNDLKKRSSVLQ